MKITVVHEITRLDDILAAFNRRTDAMAKLLPEQRPPAEKAEPTQVDPDEREFRAWAAEHAESPEEKGDLVGTWMKATRRRDCSPEERKRAIAKLVRLGVTLPAV